MSTNRCKLVIIFIVAFLSITVSERAQAPINEGWVENDLGNLRLISKFLPIESQSLKVLQEEVGVKFKIAGADVILSNPSDQFGFGYERFDVDRPGGYCHVFVHGYAFKKKYTYYKLGVDCSSDSWKQIRARIIASWKNNVKIAFKENDDGIYFEKFFDGSLQEYKDTVANEIGSINDKVKVPLSLKPHYDALLSPMENPVVGKDGCGVAGILPWGKASIDLIVKQKRIDLLENILKGYNPGGRVYAVVALLEMRKRGIALSVDTETTIKKVIDSDIILEGCFGGTGNNLTAKQILERLELK